MIAVFTSWDWTEIIEGIFTSLLFIALPIIWRMEVHATRARIQREEHHAEVMESHKAIREALK